MYLTLDLKSAVSDTSYGKMRSKDVLPINYEILDKFKE